MHRDVKLGPAYPAMFSLAMFCFDLVQTNVQTPQTIKIEPNQALPRTSKHLEHEVSFLGLESTENDIQSSQGFALQMQAAISHC